MIESSRCDIESYCERKSVWTSLLAQLRYQSNDDMFARFVACWDCPRKGKL